MIYLCHCDSKFVTFFSFLVLTSVSWKCVKMIFVRFFFFSFIIHFCKSWWRLFVFVCEVLKTMMHKVVCVPFYLFFLCWFSCTSDSWPWSVMSFELAKFIIAFIFCFRTLFLTLYKPAYGSGYYRITNQAVS